MGERTKSPPARCRYRPIGQELHRHAQLPENRQRQQDREHFTISARHARRVATEIGDDNFIMTSGHIAHNCRIGSHIVIASLRAAGRYVEVEDGRSSPARAGAPVREDRPPRHDQRQHRRQPGRPARLHIRGLSDRAQGLNLVGLKRAGFKRRPQHPQERVSDVYRSGLKLEDALAKIESEIHPGNVSL